MKKKTILTIVAVTIAVLAAGYAIFLSPLSDMIFGGAKQATLEDSLAKGRIDIKSEKDMSDLFVFVSPDEARKMLLDAEGAGKFKFILPQFNPDKDVTDLSIWNETKDVEGRPIKFMLMSGLPVGATIYANSDKFAQGGMSSGDPAYAWFRAKNLDEDIATTLYVPGPLLAGQSVFRAGIDDIFKSIAMGTPILDIKSGSKLNEELFPKDAQIAFAISKEGDFTLADMKDILTKDGKIVMLKL
ncbi:MAG: hypothetical protein PHG66_02365 [Candidatus Colwellbacteria bacterium]|nr:hypothetical protein [Candidatus Colwellbacteria bacterium]